MCQPTKLAIIAAANSCRGRQGNQRLLGPISIGELWLGLAVSRPDGAGPMLFVTTVLGREPHADAGVQGDAIRLLAPSFGAIPRTRCRPQEELPRRQGGVTG